MKDTTHDWLNEHGDYLYRFALTRLRDPHLAEDVVQETLLAAIKAPNFAGQSTARTWLTGILKHKIIDTLRRNIREVPASDLLLDESQSMDDFFDETGHWAEQPLAWDIPHAALQQSQFLSVLEACLAKLPTALASIFTMREIEDMENDEICKALNITTTNAWVMLYRARMGLRKCIELNWSI